MEVGVGAIDGLPSYSLEQAGNPLEKMHLSYEIATLRSQ
jgi:hypothetical protein